MLELGGISSSGQLAPSGKRISEIGGSPTSGGGGVGSPIDLPWNSGNYKDAAQAEGWH